MSAHGWTGHGHACCRQPGPPVDARPSAIARCGGPVLCGSCGSDAARIHASGTQGEQGAGLLARVAQLEAEAVSCSCQAWPPDGPSPDCPVHGAVRALNELNVAHAKLGRDYVRVMTERDNALAENARLRPVVEAAKELLRLKDGPRDAAYADQKPKAWAALQSALAPKWAGEGCCKAAYDSEGNVHDHPVGEAPDNSQVDQDVVALVRGRRIGAGACGGVARKRVGGNG